MKIAEVIHWKTNYAPGIQCFSDRNYAERRVEREGGNLADLHEVGAVLVYWPPAQGAFPTAPTLAQWEAEYDAQFTHDARAARAVDGTDRLQYEHLFELENRMRVLEGSPTVSAAQYRTALINRWKQLNQNGG